MFWKYLDKLRELPEDSRRSAAVTITICLGLLIWIPWFFLHGKSVPNTNDTVKPPSELLSPFAFIGEAVSGASNQLKTDWNALAGAFAIPQNAVPATTTDALVPAGPEIPVSATTTTTGTPATATTSTSSTN